MEEKQCKVAENGSPEMTDQDRTTDRHHALRCMILYSRTADEAMQKIDVFAPDLGTNLGRIAYLDVEFGVTVVPYRPENDYYATKFAAIMMAYAQELRKKKESVEGKVAAIESGMIRAGEEISREVKRRDGNDVGRISTLITEIRTEIEKWEEGVDIAKEEVLLFLYNHGFIGDIDELVKMSEIGFEKQRKDIFMSLDKTKNSIISLQQKTDPDIFYDDSLYPDYIALLSAIVEQKYR